MDVAKKPARFSATSFGKGMPWRWLALAAAVVLGVVWLLRPTRATTDGMQQAVVMRGDLQPTVEVLGTIRPIHMQTVPAQIGGRIVSIQVEPGQAVTKGTPLLVMANDAAQSDLATARMKYAEARSRVEIAQAQAVSDVASSRAQLAKARTAEAYARSQYQATLSVSKLGVVSRMQAEEVKSKLDMAIADTAAAATALSSIRKVATAKVHGQLEESNVLKQELDRHQQQVDELTVRAPMDGFIAERLAETGTNATAGTALLSFVDNSGYYVQLNVPEDAAREVKAGDAVSIAVGSRKLDGTISRVAPLAKKGYVTADAVFLHREVDLPSIDSTVQVQVRPRALRDVLYVRAPADISGSQSATVYVMPPGSHRASSRQVSFGMRVGEFITVLGGLAKGEHILIGADKTHGTEQTRS